MQAGVTARSESSSPVVGGSLRTTRIGVRVASVFAIMSYVATEVIYARVPKDLKEAADEYARTRGATLTSAVVDLIDRGLSSVSDERSVAEMEKVVSTLSADNARLEGELTAARYEAGALRTFAGRATRKVGSCPGCGSDISGYDLLAAGRCPKCDRGLSSLLVPDKTSANLDQRELLILVGALGALLGAAYLMTK